MASKSLAERIAAAKARKQAVAERLSTLEAKAKAVDRKRDTRRKIIVGGVVLSAMEKDSALAAQIRKLLQSYVGRAHDKDVLADLLGLTPAPVASSPKEPKHKAPASVVQTPTPPPASPEPEPEPEQERESITDAFQYPAPKKSKFFKL